MSESETKGRCRSEVDMSALGSAVTRAIADAIDRLAADVAAVKEAVCDGSVAEDRDRFFAGWAAALNERDKLRAEVERLRAELAAPQPAAPEPAYYLVTNERDMPIHVSRMHPGVGWDGCTITALYAAPQPAGHGISPGLPETQSAGNAAPAAWWLTERERHVLSSMLSERPCDSSLHWADDVQPVFRSLLSRAGSPPVVEVPEEKIGCRHLLHRIYRDALDKAGVSWKEA